MQTAPPKSLSASWEKLRILSVAVATVTVPVVVAWVGNSYANRAKAEELQLKYVELAVGILARDPTKENLALRSWATDIIVHYSPVPMSEEAKLFLKTQQLIVKLGPISFTVNNQAASAAEQAASISTEYRKRAVTPIDNLR